MFIEFHMVHWITGRQEKKPLLPTGINLDASLEEQAKALSSGMLDKGDGGAADLAKAHSKARKRAVPRVWCFTGNQVILDQTQHHQQQQNIIMEMKTNMFSKSVSESQLDSYRCDSQDWFW